MNANPKYWPEVYRDFFLAGMRAASITLPRDYAVVKPWIAMGYGSGFSYSYEAECWLDGYDFQKLIGDHVTADQIKEWRKL